jgi:hypothetical protein
MSNKVKEPFGFNEPASQHIPKPNAVATGELIDSEKFQEEQSKKNTLLESLNSPEMVKMREDLAEAHQKSIEASVGFSQLPRNGKIERRPCKST